MAGIRLWRLSAGAVGVAILFIPSGSTVRLSASPDPNASRSPSALVSPSALPSPTESPSPSAGIVCESPTVYEAGFEVARGGTFRVRFSGFASNTLVTVVFEDRSRGDVQRPMGASTSDGQGQGTVEGVVPRDAPIGQTTLYVVAEDGCYANSYFTVLGSPRAASIDDDTVMPGQRVTVRAGGFAPNTSVVLSIDSAPTQGECFPECHWLGSPTTTSAVGSAVIDARIPRDTSPGTHQLWVSGWSPDGISEFNVGVEITVVAGGVLPPTDTE